MAKAYPVTLYISDGFRFGSFLRRHCWEGWTLVLRDFLRFYLRRLSAPCAHLVGSRSRGLSDRRRYPVVIEPHDNPEHLMAFLGDMPSPTVRYFHNQPAHV